MVVNVKIIEHKDYVSLKLHGLCKNRKCCYIFKHL